MGLNGGGCGGEGVVESDVMRCESGGDGWLQVWWWFGGVCGGGDEVAVFRLW